MLVSFGISNAVTANTIPTHDNEKIVLVKNENLTFSIENLSDAKSFNGVTYNNITTMLKIDTKKSIEFIEILNLKGEVEYFMPVGAKFFYIDVLDFDKGTYIVNIKIQEVRDKIIRTTLERNF